jgi:hypothetical protein
MKKQFILGNVNKIRQFYLLPPPPPQKKNK